MKTRTDVKAGASPLMSVKGFSIVIDPHIAFNLAVLVQVGLRNTGSIVQIGS
jgi:hypothetical protein